MIPLADLRQWGWDRGWSLNIVLNPTTKDYFSVYDRPSRVACKSTFFRLFHTAGALPWTPPGLPATYMLCCKCTAVVTVTAAIFQADNNDGCNSHHNLISLSTSSLPPVKISAMSVV